MSTFSTATGGHAADTDSVVSIPFPGTVGSESDDDNSTPISASQDDISSEGCVDDAVCADDIVNGFDLLNLSPPVAEAVKAKGYTNPTPIQSQIIPYVLDGRDVLGQAQTGTGKTAAFALPLLSRIDLEEELPQVLVLTPTRELAIQVAASFEKYAVGLKGFRVCPIYGGQDYSGQLRQLANGVHVVVGTPGRVIDHMKRGTLRLDALSCLVLDEADEMLRMGFIDDVQYVLSQTPDERQIALFSATLPAPIRAIAQQYLRDPAEVHIEQRTATAETITQRFLICHGREKLPALRRVLEAEETDGVIVFVKTKNATLEVAEQLAATGLLCAPLNGDIAQNHRERTIESLKAGRLNIVVATDVAARGLDVQRISHVINYDLPFDVESYVHRIGRTGRAGRSGQAILFATPHEMRFLRTIERVIRQPIERMEVPSAEQINTQRVKRFKERITQTLETQDVSVFQSLIEQYQRETQMPPWKVAAALAKLLQGDAPFLLVDPPQRKRPQFEAGRPGRDSRDQGYRDNRDQDNRDRRDRGPRDQRGNDQRGRDQRGRQFESREFESGDRRRERNEFRRDDSRGPDRGDDSRGDRAPRDRAPRDRSAAPTAGMETFRLEVGHIHGVKPGSIVGAIANEAGLEGSQIGRINIFDRHSTVDLPEGMPNDLLTMLKSVRVAGQPIRISRAGSGDFRRSDRDNRQSDGDFRGSRGPKPRRNHHQDRRPNSHRQ